MSQRPPSKFKLLKWKLECVAYSVFEMAVGLLPGPWVFRIGEFMGGVTWHLMPRRRQMIVRNLRIAYAGEREIEEIHELARATMRRAGANLISGMWTARLPPQKLTQILKLENVDLLTQTLAKNKGIILLLAHMGNWELLSRLIHLLPEGTKTGAFYRPLNNVLLDEQVLARRQADGTRMFSKRDPIHQVADYLRKGALVGVLADQRVGYRGDKVNFFGRCTYSSPLPSLLARRTKCEVLAFALVTVKPGVWRGTFMPVDSPPTTQHCMHGLQAAMERSPEDVFWLQERWIAKGRKLHRAFDLLTEAEAQSDKPPRVLIWTLGEGADWRPDEKSLSAPVVCEFAVAQDAEVPGWIPKEAKCHRVAQGMDIAECRKAIRAIDHCQSLPLDLILAGHQYGQVAKAAKREGVRALPLWGEMVGSSLGC